MSQHLLVVNTSYLWFCDMCSKLTMMEMESWAWKSTPTCSKNSRFPSLRWWSWWMMIIVVIVMIIMSIMFISAFFLIDGVGHVNYVNCGTGSIWQTWRSMNKDVAVKTANLRLRGTSGAQKWSMWRSRSLNYKHGPWLLGSFITNFPTYFMKHWKH